MKSVLRVVRRPLSPHANKCAHSHAPLCQLFNKSRWIAQFHIFIEWGSRRGLYDVNFAGISVHETTNERISFLDAGKKYFETKPNLELNATHYTWTRY